MPLLPGGRWTGSRSLRSQTTRRPASQHRGYDKHYTTTTTTAADTTSNTHANFFTNPSSNYLSNPPSNSLSNPPSNPPPLGMLVPKSSRSSHRPRPCSAPPLSTSSPPSYWWPCHRLSCCVCFVQSHYPPLATPPPSLTRPTWTMRSGASIGIIKLQVP